MGSPRNYSESTAQKIDAEVKRLIDTAYDRATELIKTHRDKLDAIAKGLLEYETLDAKHIHEIMEHGEIQNPPSSPPRPISPPRHPKNAPWRRRRKAKAVSRPPGPGLTFSRKP